MLTKEQLNHFKQLIIEERDNLLKELGYLNEPSLADALNESSQGSNAYAYHIADQGTDSQEREKAYIFAARDNRYLNQLAEALERIDEGSYGVCTTCNNDIEVPRLEAVLVAKQHIQCKNRKIKSSDDSTFTKEEQ